MSFKRDSSVPSDDKLLGTQRELVNDESSFRVVSELGHSSIDQNPRRTGVDSQDSDSRNSQTVCANPIRSKNWSMYQLMMYRWKLSLTVDKKQHHEPEDGVLFTLQRWCLLYWTGVRCILYANVHSLSDHISQYNCSSYNLYVLFMMEALLRAIPKSLLKTSWQLWKLSLSRRKTRSRPSSTKHLKLVFLDPNCKEIARDGLTAKDVWQTFKYQLEGPESYTKTYVLTLLYTNNVKEGFFDVDR